MGHRISTVFLDRDGVINRKAPEGEYVESWEQFEFLPGAIEALQLLRRAGVRVLVVTNQRGVARHRMTLAAVDEIHERMNARLAESGAECAAILVCPHDQGECNCRKPLLGLFRTARTMFPDLDPASSVVVGDSAADVAFGNRLGCPTYFVGDARQRADVLESAPDLRIDDGASTLLEIVTDRLGFGDSTTIRPG